MPFVATKKQMHKTRDYIVGDPIKNISLMIDRWYYLLDLYWKNELTLAFRDPVTEKWTKWESFPGLLIKEDKLTPAIDVHRSLLPNEIVIESDYPTYEENYEATKVLGPILESKGFIPHYYFSGNKSIHTHIFFNWNCLFKLEPIVGQKLYTKYKGSTKTFKGRFIKWLRKKMISCWDTHAKQFDEELINAKHLIRCELSKNKRGYKTFIGYTWKDLSMIPYICNESNEIYPQLGKIKLSSPKNITGLIEEFLDDIERKTQAQRRNKRNTSLGSWIKYKNSPELRPCVKFILSDEFRTAADGYSRAMFILINACKEKFSDEKAREMVLEWNERMGSPNTESEIEYRLNKKTYTIGCKYVHAFLKEIGYDVNKICNG